MDIKTVKEKPKKKTYRLNELNSLDVPSRSKQLNSQSSAPVQWPEADECQKCHGLLVVIPGELPRSSERRCVNCGWQPQFGMRVMKESEESKALRRQTAKFFAEPGSLPRVKSHKAFPVSNNLSLKQKQARIVRSVLSTLMRDGS